MVEKANRALKYFFFGFFLLYLSSVFAQTQKRPDCPKSENKKAIKLYEQAEELYKDRKYTEAQELIEKSVEQDPEFADANLLRGYVSIKKKEFRTMEESFLKVIEVCPDLDAEMYYQLGWLYFDYKKFPEAEKNLKRYLEFDKLDESKAVKADEMLAKAKLMSHPVPFDPKPVPGLSTTDPEYLPYISPDNELAFFTRRFDQKDKNMLVPQNVEKFIFAKMKDGSFDHGKPMPLPFNAAGSNNEGGATITIDNMHLFFTVNKNGNFDICTSDYTEYGWEKISNLGSNVNDPKQWDAQPSISADGKTLYFASARDSLSGIDIYFTEKDDNGIWGKAKKMPSSINTDANDKSPFIHSDSHTLYFSSNGLPGLGGYDIYMSKMDSSGIWSKPKNLGYPINTEEDEVGFFVSTDGRTGYFASNRMKGAGGYDIYSFDLYPEARPDKVLFIKGQVKDGGENEMLNATIELQNAKTKDVTKVKVDSLTGKYAAVVSFSEDYLLTVKKEGYAFQSQYISKKDSLNEKPVKVDLEIKKIEVGEQYPLNDILFATNSSDINDTIKLVLDNFAEYLKENPKLKVAINGHTDNIGNPDDNLTLSENRANTVYQYLAQRGIDKSRISYKGFGETKPVASNEMEEGRAKNRRTVFVVNAK